VNGLSFITPIAYDYRYAFSAIRSYYDIAEEIILGLDESLISWSGKPFEMDKSELFGFINEIDVEAKIFVITGNFHESKNPMENDTAERCILSQHARPGNWVCMIDSTRSC